MCCDHLTSFLGEPFDPFPLLRIRRYVGWTGLDGEGCDLILCFDCGYHYRMADTSQTHIHIPTSDLHRIYVPAGKWAVAMVDGRQVILDPAAKSTDVKTERGSDEGNGIWIFRSQHLVLEGPEPIDSKVTSLFNVTRLQVSAWVAFV
jgi:hypothetical protein